MPYRVLGDEVSIHKAVGEFYDNNGKIIGYDHDSVIYLKDDIVADEDVSPDVVKIYDSGDERIRTLIVRVDAKGKPVEPVAEPAERKVAHDEPTVSKAGTGEVKVTPIDPPEGPAKKASTKTAAEEK
jgi:hypothetical protein